MRTVVIVIVMLLSILGPSAVIGAIGFSSIKALGRNPSSAPKIMLAMIVSLIFAMSLAVIALLVIFHLFGK